MKTLDAHAHLDPQALPAQLQGSGFVLAQTMSLSEAEEAAGRSDRFVAWGVGCHPRSLAAQQEFEPDRFRRLIAATAICGEVGLDGSSAVPRAIQLRTFRAILDELALQPRITSIHSHRATKDVLHELSAHPVNGVILHWWNGTAEETSRAVEMGCYFSIHAQVARRWVFRTRVPLERVLIETDHGERDPVAAIPLRIGWVEHLVAQSYGVPVEDIRRASWANFHGLLGQLAIDHLLPSSFMP